MDRLRRGRGIALDRDGDYTKTNARTTRLCLASGNGIRCSFIHHVGMGQFESLADFFEAGKAGGYPV